MEALSLKDIPEGPGWQYEPKWDGFRCLVFRDGDNVYLQSKAEKPLGRYFPDLVAALKQLDAQSFVLDGEIAVPIHGKLDFEQLLQRIHPAASRVNKLAAEYPALFIAFDLLAAADGRSLTENSLRERRRLLEPFAERYFVAGGAIRLSPATTSLVQAKRWLRGAGSNLDGIIGKLLDSPYRSGDRSGMVKVKLVRSVDCVVGGFRYGTGEQIVGSLLLGLYDDQGLLHHVGFTSSFKDSERPALTKTLEKLIKPTGFTGGQPGGPSRWSSKRSTEWQPLAAKLVVEVTYDHFTAGRFRHGTTLLRWRPDKAPRQCSLNQVIHGRGASLHLLEQTGHAEKRRRRA